MEIISSEKREKGENKEIERIKREVTEDIEMAMEVRKDEPFHNEKHPKSVGASALRIIDIFEAYSDQVTPDTRLAAKTAADMHDLIIDFVVAQDPKAFNYGQRIRLRGFGELMPDNVKKILKELGETKGNEEKSWEKGEEIIKKRDPEEKVYTRPIMTAIKESVAATYPDAKMDRLPKEYVTSGGEVLIKDSRTGEMVNVAPHLSKDADGNIIALHFSQPLLTKESDISSLAIATSDIMYGGKVSFEKFKMHGNEEFRELYELIRKDVESGADKLTEERKSEIAKAALGWISIQVGFLLWQKIEFNNRLENFDAIEKSRDPKALKKALIDEYLMFDPNIIDSKNRADNARARWGNLVKPDVYKTDLEANIKFRELLGEMGF